jgi:hypothetical protein
MENRNQKKYNFIAQVLILFAVDVLFLILIASLFGDGAKEISNMYQFGSKGLATSTLLQFLLSSVFVIFFKSLFFSERIIKSMLTLWRAVLLLLSILLSMILFIIIFHWFPIDNFNAWTGFFVCFGGGFVVSTAYMIIKTKRDNRKYNELLSNYKNQHEGDSDYE